MSMPGGISAPGAELVRRVSAAAPATATLVVVNCAGRTRSIIGAQSLINAGVPDRVMALRNGTIGWTLDGLALEHGQARRAPVPGPERGPRRAVPREWWPIAPASGGSIADGVRERPLPTSPHHLPLRRARTPEDYCAWHPAGFRSAPGGQLVQETDVFAPVRGARIVLWDDAGSRADMTASWLAQMNWDVWVLDEPATVLAGEAAEWRATPAPLPDVPLIDARRP